MKADQIVIDVPKTLGSNILCAEVRENKIYENGKPTGETDGCVYDCFCFDRKMLKISFKITGKAPLITVPEGEYVSVDVIGAILKPYVMNNQINFTATAQDIKVKKEG